MNKSKYLIVVVAAVAMVVVYRLSLGPIEFKGYNAATFTQQLTPLVLVALFIERSLEVFLTVWRGGQETILQREVDKATQLVKTDLAKTDPTTLSKVHEAEDHLAEYRYATQRIAIHAALILGILISALGVRGLGNLADLTKLADHPTQKHMFSVADVLLTGALVGGGSDFMHKVITTFTDLMDATSQKAKANV